MATKEDVIKAAEEYGRSSFLEGLRDNDAYAFQDAIDEAKAALENFKQALNEFEKTLLSKREEPCNQ